MKLTAILPFQKSERFHVNTNQISNELGCLIGVPLVCNFEPWFGEPVAVLKFLWFSAGVFIVAAKRTPFGTYGGVLKDHSATDLAEHTAKAALAAGSVAPELVNSVIFGNVMQVPNNIYSTQF